MQKIKIKSALVSVSDKTGIVEFVKFLKECGVRIYSTGGTATLLMKNSIDVTLVSDHTGFPEMLDGRVKTLHPKIHGGILGLRDNETHVSTMKENKIDPIDMVVVNLYPFEKTVAKKDVLLEEAIENIDIGGPSMLRSAAKNYRFVSAISDPQDYTAVLEEMKLNEGSVSETLNRDLSMKAFKHTALYDGAIANFLSKGDVVTYPFEKIQDLRYGENPHQGASFYKDIGSEAKNVLASQKIQGKELSFNNILDADATVNLLAEFDKQTAVILKHMNPCGVAQADDLESSYVEAREVDPISAFGGIIGFNRNVDLSTANSVISTFVEMVIAPSFDQDALSAFAKKPNIRLLQVGDLKDFKSGTQKDMKKVIGGLLVQERDTLEIDQSSMKVVTNEKPSEAQWRALLFNWKVCKHVKSNAIVCGGEKKVIGIGAGQMNRVQAVHIALGKIETLSEDCVLASDGFFPFKDSVELAAKAGVKAIIQPGGSLRDAEVIEACDKYKIAMVLTGNRHFKH
ncbi:bifunctional phosphoribosylaminoimidazolecarboxamide formyltransferase/IMP cyclohydrolase [PVC group bacterium (ex Bugula neritina AB1)]|nr:bifunctional phosphoribosylaminoimidazolecarboxamide formyltransferase/IMP cyclohydrolase [PVC group bacterium (ex Bugula neritina AB1)]